MPFCPYCGSATVPDGQFCPNCGRQLPTKTEAADGGASRAPDDQPVGTDVGAPPPPLFLSAPDEYDGGELEIEGPFGAQVVKLDAGDMVLYPSSSLHRVTPVTRGARIASFFWIQSHVADERARGLLFDLDRAIQGLTPGLPADDPNLLALTGVYHNLLRRWAVA